jgi:hypothetical protein
MKKSCFLIIFLLLGSAATAYIDPYGGDTRITGSNTDGYFRVEKIDGRYWLLTPDNHGFFSLAHTTTLYNDTWGGYCPPLNSYPNPYGNRAKYNGSYSAWVANLLTRMDHYGFNSLGAWCQSGIPELTECVRVLSIAGTAGGLGCRMAPGGFPDVWDPAFHQACVNRSNSLTGNSTNPYTIGSFPDNELHWNGTATWSASGEPLAELLIDFPAEAHGKQYFVNTFLPSRYASVAALNTAWGTSYADWTAVLNMTSADIPDNPTHPARFADKLDFTEAIADRYYSETTGAMRAADPNHLVFSARWALWTAAYRDDGDWERHARYAERVWRKAGEYCDVLALNSYIDFEWLETDYSLLTRLFGNAGRPVMITEWAMWADDTAFAYNPGWNRYQKNRAEYYEKQIKYLVDLELPNDPNDGQPANIIVGTQWFQFYDEPSLGRTDLEKMNFGLYNVKDEAYFTCLDHMRSVNLQVYDRLIDASPITILESPDQLFPCQLTIAGAIASSELGGWPKEHVIDGNPGLSWSSQSMPGPTGSTQYIGLDFGQTYNNIASLTAIPRYDPNPAINCFPVDFSIQTSDDGTAWSTIAGQTYTDYPNPNGAEQMFSFTPVSARYIRIFATKFRQDDYGNYFMQMAELSVEQTPPGIHITDPRPTFEWETVPGAASYSLLYSPEKCFPESQTIRVEGITDLTYQPDEPLTSGRWYWCVSAVDDSGLHGLYAGPVVFDVTGVDHHLETSRYLKMEDLSAWRHVALEDGGWDATVYAFPDSASRTEGNYAARVVFTVNSLNKETGLKNAATDEVAFSYIGPRLNFKDEDQVYFDIMPARVVDASGVMTVASKYVRFRMKNSAGETLVDEAVDPSGSLPPLEWTRIEFPLPDIDKSRVTTVEFSVSCAQEAVPWDQRITVWLDNFSPDPLTASVGGWAALR